MKHIVWLIIGILFFPSCKQNQIIPDTSSATTSNSETIQYSTAPAQNFDTTTSPPPSQTIKPKQPKSVKPIGTFKSYADIVRHMFTIGSTKKEVLFVMGNPEFVDDATEKEAWYYGKTEIKFWNEYVSDVINGEETSKYSHWDDLLTSDDPIERDFGIRMVSRSAKVHPY